MSRWPFVHIFMVTVHSLTRPLCYSSVHWYAINHAGLLPLSFGAFAPLATLEKVLIVIKPCNLALYVAITDISMGTFSFFFFFPSNHRPLLVRWLSTVCIFYRSSFTTSLYYYLCLWYPCPLGIPRLFCLFFRPPVRVKCKGTLPVLFTLPVVLRPHPVACVRSWCVYGRQLLAWQVSVCLVRTFTRCAVTTGCDTRRCAVETIVGIALFMFVSPVFGHLYGICSSSSHL